MLALGAHDDEGFCFGSSEGLAFGRALLGIEISSMNTYKQDYFDGTL